MKHKAKVGWALVAAVLAGAGAPAWPGETAGGPRASAALAALTADLRGTDSASEVLRRWCEVSGWAKPAAITAIRQGEIDKPADAGVRALLSARPGEAIRYRRVKLTCGVHVLSEADNWYLPARLTPEMNRRLETTQTPFGVVARPLAFHRRIVEIEPLAGPRQALRVRAVLIAGAGAPFSVVAETYSRELLSITPPPSLNTGARF
ncbi:MAG: hypothetical protein H0X27_05375 [Caulobacteraceae bacterium]|nr:hypothetical protein [Caulobacteraceae bacterium]